MNLSVAFAYNFKSILEKMMISLTPSWAQANVTTPYFERHHHLHFSFYTSPKLLLELEKIKTYAFGTVRSNKGQFPTNSWIILKLVNLYLSDYIGRISVMYIWCLQYMTMVLLSTEKNTVISSNFMVWKFCGKAQIPHSFGRIAQNYGDIRWNYGIFRSGDST